MTHFTSNPADLTLDPTLTVLEPTGLKRRPLHAQVRDRLRKIVCTHFKDGDKFYSEPVLARQLGVSPGTVRRALADLAREGLLIRKVPQGTFVRRPEASARTAVGIFTPQYESSFLMAILAHLSAHCREANRPLHVYHTHRSQHTDDALSHLQRPPAEERVILLGETPAAARSLYGSLNRQGYRVVNVDTLLPDAGDAYVGVDNDAALRLAVGHLRDLGHRRLLLLVNEPSEAGNSLAQVRVFHVVTREYGLQATARTFDCGTQFWEDSAAAAARSIDRWLSLSPRPTAVVTVSAAGAWAILQGLRERGIQVPDDMSVLSLDFDENRPSQFMNPPLTTVAQPVAELARRALEFLDASVVPPGYMYFVRPSLIVRSSTAPLLAERTCRARSSRKAIGTEP